MNCYKCHNSGFIVASKKINKCLYTYTCDSCGTAAQKNLSKLFQKWDDRLLKTYDTSWHTDIAIKSDLNEVKPINTITPDKTKKIDIQALRSNDDTFKEDIKPVDENDLNDFFGPDNIAW